MKKASREDLHRIVEETRKYTGWPDPERAIERLKQEGLEYDALEFFAVVQEASGAKALAANKKAGRVAFWGLVLFWVALGAIVAVAILSRAQG
jgi:hypothetical protein